MATSKNQRTEKEMDLSFMTIRKAVGWLGIALPIIVSVGTWVFGCCAHLKPSVSSYYYTTMGNFLTGILCAVALFMFTYKGFDWRDQLATNIAGFFAASTAIFPTDYDPHSAFCDVFSKLPGCISNKVHYLSAAIFFVTLAYTSIFLFTKSDKNKIERGIQKRRRNRIYRTCGIIMVVALLLILSLQITTVSEAVGKYDPEFFLETITLWAFGFSWLVKGETILKDHPPQGS